MWQAVCGMSGSGIYLMFLLCFSGSMAPFSLALCGPKLKTHSSSPNKDIGRGMLLLMGEHLCLCVL